MEITGCCSVTGDCIYEAAPINIHYTQLYLQYLIQTDDPGNSILITILMQLFYALPLRDRQKWHKGSGKLLLWHLIGQCIHVRM